MLLNNPDRYLTIIARVPVKKSILRLAGLAGLALVDKKLVTIYLSHT